ncbi:MAG: hypothetical protein DRJ47_08645 [Thermoprotei archaeon]|nr:MAG: hypothetical protein DRJ47_08645 [Thermoprotei archaeon]
MKWLPEEVEVLKKLYGKKPAREIAKILRRSMYSIEKKARSLGLHRQDYWTKEEIEILEQHYTYASKEELLELLPKRTWNAIQNKAKQLGLKRRTRFKNEQDFKEYLESLRKVVEF